MLANCTCQPFLKLLLRILQVGTLRNVIDLQALGRPSVSVRPDGDSKVTYPHYVSIVSSQLDGTRVGGGPSDDLSPFSFRGDFRWHWCSLVWCRSLFS